MEKTCQNCGWNISTENIVINCQNDFIYGSSRNNCMRNQIAWKPKEEVKEVGKMRMTAEEWDEILNDCVFMYFNSDEKLPDCELRKMSIEKTKHNLRQKGYVKKSDLEIAKERYHRGMYVSPPFTGSQVRKNYEYIQTAIEYIKELEKELERDKKKEYK